MDAFAAVYTIGLIVAWIALYLRPEFPPSRGWLEFLIPNLWWFGLMGLKIWAWPITLAHWVYNGCGPSSWKAVTVLDGREVRRIVRVGASA